MRYPDGGVVNDADMWTYWRLLEGEVALKDGHRYRTADDKDPPVLHVELMNTPVKTESGKEFPDKHFLHVCALKWPERGGRARRPGRHDSLHQRWGRRLCSNPTAML